MVTNLIQILTNRLIAIFTLSLILSACSDGSSSGELPPESGYQYQKPLQFNDGWSTASLLDYNISTQNIEVLVANIIDQKAGYRYIDSIAISHKGTLVLDENFRTSLDFADDWANNRDLDLHVINSVTKSVTSALIGIAIDQGYIESVEVPVHDYFQHKLPIANWDSDKANVRLHDWLSMRHGYEWDEWDVSYLEPANLNSQMIAADDPIQFLLDRPMATEPGTHFAYSTGVSFALGRILQLATGDRVHRFLERELLTPLQITDYDFWQLDSQLHTGSALYLKTRDMAKFGQLYLNRGVWNGQQIISESWVETSTQQRLDLNTSGTAGYGYQWWMTQYQVGESVFSSYYADGFGGQYIFIVPELELVIAMTGSAYEYEQTKERNIRKILEQELLTLFIDT